MNRILAEIDAQIAKLQQARALLAGTTTGAKSGPGRPKGSKNLLKAAVAAAAPKKKRKMSAAGRARIAAAQKARWAAARKAK